MKRSFDGSIFWLIPSVLTLILASLLSTGPSHAQESPGLYPPDDAPTEPSAEDLDAFGLSIRSEERITPRALPLVGGSWTAQGPGPAYFGQIEGITNREVAGAIHTVVAHPTDANIVWLGAANGGVWKTTNAQAASPTWTQLTDSESSLSVGAMELDPTDGTHQTIVAGKGRYSSLSLVGGPLDGMLRSTDGGTNWTAIGDPLLDGESCSGIAARGSTLLFASGENYGFGGLFRSTNTGTSWSKIDGTGGTGLPLNDVFDLVGDPNVSTRFYLTLDDTGVYRSDNSGATWVNISDASQIAVFAAGNNNNAELAVAPNGRVYVAIIISGQARAIEYTDNPTAGSPAWTSMDLPTTPTGSGKSVTGATNASPIVITTSAAHGFSSGNFVQVQGVTGNTAANGVFSVTSLSTTTLELRGSAGNGVYISGGTVTRVNGLNPGSEKPGGQGGIHFSILVDSADSATVYIGGDRQDLDTSPNFIGAQDFSGRLWRGDTTISPTGASPSPQWEHLTHSNAIATIPGGGTANGSSPHADSRQMAMDINGDLIETDDGGIYRRTSPADNTGDWFSMNGTVVINEQHDVAYDTVSNIVISGNQDTGTTQQQTPGGLTWNSVSTADGGDVAVDAISSPPNSIRYSSFQNLGGFRRVTYNSSNVVQATAFPALAGFGSWAAQFITPIEVNAVDGARIVIGGANGILESLNKGDNATYLVTAAINWDCLAYGANANAAALYAASDVNVLVRLAGSAAPVTTAAAFPGGYVRDLVIDPGDENTLYVIDSQSVFVTTTAGAGWTNITGDLVNSDLNSIEFMDGVVPSIAVSGLGGVFQMESATPGVWAQLGSGVPTVLVYDLDYDPVDDVLVAGTMGRGAWLLQNANSGSGFSVSAGGFEASGDPGGPFAPTSKTYTVSNSSGSSLNWTASSDAFWIGFAPSSGTLSSGASIEVDAIVNGLAVFATPGDHTGTLSFNDTTNTLEIQRSTILNVTNPDDVSLVYTLDSNPGWTTTGQWAFGAPTGQGGADHGNPDPTAGATGSNVFGVNLNGDYAVSVTAQRNLTAGPVDLSNTTDAALNFKRWLNTDFQPFVSATVQVSNNGSAWTTIWDNGSANETADAAWTDQTFDISAVAAGQPTVYVRWGYAVLDSGAYNYSGWNIDDVTISATGQALTMLDEVWLDFAYTGTEDGSEAQPVNTFDEAETLVIPGGAIRIKGNTAQNNTPETPTIQRPVTIQAVSGKITIGKP